MEAHILKKLCAKRMVLRNVIKSRMTLKELWRKLELFMEKLWRMHYDLMFYKIEEMEKQGKIL